MLRALSTRRSCQYERLGKDSAATGPRVGGLKRAMSVPARVFGSSKLTPAGSTLQRNKSQAKQAKKASKIHPLFGLFSSSRRKNKPTAKPEFARYLDYVKEGGIWNAGSSMPAIYYK